MLDRPGCLDKGYDPSAAEVLQVDVIYPTRRLIRIGHALAIRGPDGVGGEPASRRQRHNRVLGQVYQPQV